MMVFLKFLNTNKKVIFKVKIIIILRISEYNKNQFEYLITFNILEYTLMKKIENLQIL